MRLNRTSWERSFCESPFLMKYRLYVIYWYWDYVVNLWWTTFKLEYGRFVNGFSVKARSAVRRVPLVDRFGRRRFGLRLFGKRLFCERSFCESPRVQPSPNPQSAVISGCPANWSCDLGNLQKSVERVRKQVGCVAVCTGSAGWPKGVLLVRVLRQAVCVDEKGVVTETIDGKRA